MGRRKRRKSWISIEGPSLLEKYKNHPLMGVEVETVHIENPEKYVQVYNPLNKLYRLNYKDTEQLLPSYLGNYCLRTN